MVFADVRRMVQLEATGYSAGSGLGMGVSPLENCMDKYKRTEGGIAVWQ